MFKIEFIDRTWPVESTPEEAYEKFSDIDRWSNWASVILESGRTGEGDLEEGEVIHFKPSILPITSLGAKIFENNRPNKLSWGVELPGGRIEHGFEFKEDGDKNYFRQYEYLEGPVGPVGYPLKPLLKNFDSNWGSDLQSLLNQ